MKYREITTQDWIKSVLRVAIFIVIIIFSSIYFLPNNWIAWITIEVVGVALLVKWHSQNFAYECPKCSRQFAIPFSSEFFSPNGFDKKYLKCPSCQKRSWMRVLSINKYK